MIAVVSLILAVVSAAPQGSQQGQFQRSQPGQSFDLRCQDRFGVQTFELNRQQGDIVVGIQCQPIVNQEQTEQVEQPNCRETQQVTLQTGVQFQQSCNEQEYLAGIQSQFQGQGQRSIRLTCCRVGNTEIRSQERYISQPIDVIQPQDQQQFTGQAQQNQINPEVTSTGQQLPRQIITRLQINNVVVVAEYSFVRVQGQQYGNPQLPQNRPLFDNEIQQLPELQDGQFSEQTNEYRRQCPQGQAITNVEVRTTGQQGQQGQQVVQTRYQCQPIPGQQQQQGQVSRRTTHFQYPTGQQPIVNGPVSRQLSCMQGEYVCGIVRTQIQQGGQHGGQGLRFAQQCCSTGQIRVTQRETVRTTVVQQATDLVNLLQRLRGGQNVRLVNIMFNGPQTVAAQYGQLEQGQPGVGQVTEVNNGDNEVKLNIDDLVNQVFGQPQVNQPMQQQIPFPLNGQGNMQGQFSQNIVEVEQFMCQPGYGITTWELVDGVEQQRQIGQGQGRPGRESYRFQCQPVATKQQQQQQQQQQQGQQNTQEAQCRYTQPRSVYNGLSFDEMDSNCLPQEYVAGFNQLAQNGQPMVQLRCCQIPQVARLGESCYTTEPQNMMPRMTRQPLPVTQTGRIQGVRQVGARYAQELMQSIQFNPNMEVVARFCVFSVNGQSVELEDVTTQVPPPQGTIGQLEPVQPGELTPVGRGYQVRCQSGEAVAALKVRRNSRPQQGQDIQFQVTCATPTSYVGRVFRRFTRLTSQNGQPLGQGSQCTHNEYVCGIIADYQGGARGFGLECCSASGITRDQVSQPQTETVQLNDEAQPLISKDFGNGVILQQLTITNMNEMTGVFQRFRIRNGQTEQGNQGQCRVQQVFDQTKQLTSQAFYHFQVPDVASCVTICRQHPFCLSAGYQPSTGGSRDTEAVCILSYGQGQCPQMNGNGDQQNGVDEMTFQTGGEIPQGQFPEGIPTMTPEGQSQGPVYPEYLKPVDQVSNNQPTWLTCIRC